MWAFEPSPLRYISQRTIFASQLLPPARVEIVLEHRIWSPPFQLRYGFLWCRRGNSNRFFGILRFYEYQSCETSNLSCNRTTLSTAEAVAIFRVSKFITCRRPCPTCRDEYNAAVESDLLMPYIYLNGWVSQKCGTNQRGHHQQQPVHVLLITSR